MTVTQYSFKILRRHDVTDGQMEKMPYHNKSEVLLQAKKNINTNDKKNCKTIHLFHPYKKHYNECTHYLISCIYKSTRSPWTPWREVIYINSISSSCTFLLKPSSTNLTWNTEKESVLIINVIYHLCHLYTCMLFT